MDVQPMMLMEMNDEAACEACDGETDVALGAWTCRSRWRALGNPSQIRETQS